MVLCQVCLISMHNRLAKVIGEEAIDTLPYHSQIGSFPSPKGRGELIQCKYFVYFHTGKGVKTSESYQDCLAVYPSRRSSI
jgi:hypothetical protein